MLDHVLNLPYSHTIVPCPLLSSAHISSLFYGLLFSHYSYITFPCLTVPHHTPPHPTPCGLILSYFISYLTPASPIPHLQHYFNQPSFPPPSIPSFPILSHSPFHCVPSYAVSLQHFPYPTSLRSILLALFYLITSKPILPHPLSHSALYHLFLSYLISHISRNLTPTLSCPILPHWPSSPLPLCFTSSPFTPSYLIPHFSPLHSILSHPMLPKPPSRSVSNLSLFQTLFQTSRSVSSPSTLSHFIPHLSSPHSILSHPSTSPYPALAPPHSFHSMSLSSPTPSYLIPSSSILSPSSTPLYPSYTRTYNIFQGKAVLEKCFYIFE